MRLKTLDVGFQQLFCLERVGETGATTYWCLRSAPNKKPQEFWGDDATAGRYGPVSNRVAINESGGGALRRALQDGGALGQAVAQPPAAASALVVILQCTHCPRTTRLLRHALCHRQRSRNRRHQWHVLCTGCAPNSLPV